jgi:simple sugar transport system permease protein
MTDVRESDAAPATESGVEPATDIVLPSERRSRRVGAVAFVRGAALLPVLGVLLVVGALASPVFFSVDNLANVGQQASALGFIVMGESLIIMIGGMDLSLESTFGLAPMLSAYVMVPVAAFGAGTLWGPIPGLLVLLGVGVVVGFINGFAIVKFRLNGFIWTLAMTIILYGLQDGIVSGQSLPDEPSAWTYLGSAYWGQIPVSLVFTVVVFIVVGLFLRYHRWGRDIFAVGGNRAAARAAGIRVDRVRIGVYVAGSVLAAIGGLLEAGRVLSVASSQGYGEGIIFNTFAAAVIGGVSLKGGRGGMLGAGMGVILLALVQNILDLGQVNVYYVSAIDGAVILFALILARVIGGEAAAD